MEIICDQCRKQILVLPEEKEYGNGIIETYFNCSHCQHRYSVTFTDEMIRKRIKKFADEWAKLNRLKDGEEWEKKEWMRKYKKLQTYKAATDQMVNKLKERMASV
ncbi:hypothetical protein [Pseudobacillus badius]|uniref:hypothetical protein n=1 Tax=Bacillus badius TaxID=1455 RepID=UPI0007B3B503|nr:hypothetical protein [Bacillus badius]KZR60401.1 hypothetical protein A3781_09525 [Bacillus badius]